MKVLVVKPSYFFPSNGGEISLLENMGELQNRGHQVRALSLVNSFDQSLLEGRGFLESDTKDSGTYTLFNQSFELRVDSKFRQHDPQALSDFQEELAGLLVEWEPDEVWTHYTDFLCTAAAIRLNHAPVIVRQTDFEFPRLSALQTFPEIYEAYRRITHLQVASAFMQRAVQKEFPQAQVRLLLNSMNRLKQEPLTREKKYWVMVNPVKVKGFDFFCELATQRPLDSFMVVGNWGHQAPPPMPPGMKFLERQEDLKKIWREARALLMPSVWQEAFGRLPLEAMSVGVPVLASDRGSLPETVGVPECVLPLEKTVWMRAMDELAGREQFLIQKAHHRVEAYLQEVDRNWSQQFGART